MLVPMSVFLRLLWYVVPLSFFACYLTLRLCSSAGGSRSQWPGIAVVLQNLFIFAGSLVYKFGRSEELWG